MASITIKGTYALDPETVAQLERMARRWGVSKSEALRRAIRQAAISGGGPDAAREGVLDRLQEEVALSAPRAAAWEREVRAERTVARVAAPKRK